MESIEITEKKVTTILNLNFETQISKNGRPMRYSGIKKNSQLPSQWIDKMERWHYIYTFIYLDNQGGFVEFEFDYNNNFYQVLK